MSSTPPPGNWCALTVLGTTDLHGNVYNWDYYKNQEFDNHSGLKPVSDAIGLARAATLIEAMRKERKGEPILTLDAGDTIQGTPLAYSTRRSKIDGDTVHLMARAMNLVGYDAAALSNHEFNYGIPILHLRGPARLPAPRRERRRPGDQAPGVQALHHPHVPGRPRSPAWSACSA